MVTGETAAIGSLGQAGGGGALARARASITAWLSWGFTIGVVQPASASAPAKLDNRRRAGTASGMPSRYIQPRHKASPRTVRASPSSLYPKLYSLGRAH